MEASKATKAYPSSSLCLITDLAVIYLLSLPCDEVPNCLAKERCQEGVKWGRLLQERIQSFQQRLLIAKLIIDHSHITCQQLTCYI